METKPENSFPSLRPPGPGLFVPDPQRLVAKALDSGSEGDKEAGVWVTGCGRLQTYFSFLLSLA